MSAWASCCSVRQPALMRRAPSFSSVTGREIASTRPADEIDEAELLEVADLEHAGGRALREELQDARQIEAEDGSLKQHVQARVRSLTPPPLSAPVPALR